MTNEEFGQKLREYLKENASFEVRQPSWNDSSMGITLIIDGESICEASIYSWELPKE